MRFSPIFWLLPNENFIEGNLDRDTLHMMYCGTDGVFQAVA